MSGKAGIPQTPQYLEEKAKLPDALHQAFEELVEAYRFYAFSHHQRPFVSYKVLASLVLDGWRRAKESANQGS